MKNIAFATNKSEDDLRPKRDDTSYPMTPDQYYDQSSRARHLDGEIRLLLAVLEDAIRCYTLAARSGRRSHQRALEEVKEWVNTRGDHDLFSFDSICRVFDLEPDLLRHQLDSMRGANLRPRRLRTVGRRTTIAIKD
jgi:hypothetical protein